MACVRATAAVGLKDAVTDDGSVVADDAAAAAAAAAALMAMGVAMGSVVAAPAAAATAATPFWYGDTLLSWSTSALPPIGSSAPENDFTVNDLSRLETYIARGTY